MPLTLSLPEPKPLGDTNFRPAMVAFFKAFSAYRTAHNTFVGALDLSKVEAIAPHADKIKAVGAKKDNIDKVNADLDKIELASNYF